MPLRLQYIDSRTLAIGRCHATIEDLKNFAEKGSGVSVCRWRYAPVGGTRLEEEEDLQL